MRELRSAALNDTELCPHCGAPKDPNWHRVLRCDERQLQYRALLDGRFWIAELGGGLSDVSMLSRLGVPITEGDVYFGGDHWVSPELLIELYEVGDYDARIADLAHKDENVYMGKGVIITSPAGHILHKMGVSAIKRMVNTITRARTGRESFGIILADEIYQHHVRMWQGRFEHSADVALLPVDENDMRPGRRDWSLMASDKGMTPRLYGSWTDPISGNVHLTLKYSHHYQSFVAYNTALFVTHVARFDLKPGTDLDSLRRTSPTNLSF